MIDESQVAYCGLYCGDCIIRNGRLAILAQELLSQMRNPEFGKLAEGLPKIMPDSFEPLKDYKRCIRVLESMIHLDCDKLCKDGGGSTDCSIRACCQDTGIEGCWLCDEFESCKNLSWINPVNKDAHRQNIRIIRQNGVDEFLKGSKHW